MKILMVNKFHYIKGGSETYYFALKKLLEKQGHKVIDFSMKDDKNFPSEYEEYFVDHVDYGKASGLTEKIKMAANIIYSYEAKEKFEKIIQIEKPDIVHLHLFQHQISPSILDVIKKYHLPTVYTAHEFKMLCPNYKMMHNGQICEACKGGNYWNCAKNKCVKDSFLKSCINTVEGYFHKWRKSYDVIDYIITPSKFYHDKFVEFGTAKERVIAIPNFLEREMPVVNVTEDREKYFLYIGRLSEEKGILTLIKAAQKANITLKIVGSGPMEQIIASTVKDSNNITILGFKSGQELIDVVGNAKAVVLPSEWNENGPYSAIEALQLERPIIGSNIAGIPELIEDNGYLFEGGNDEELAHCLIKMDQVDTETYERMKSASGELFKRKYTSSVHMPQLLKVYNKAMNK